YLGRAEARYYGNDLAGALADCDEAEKREPTRATAHDHRGDILLEKGAATEALEAYGKAVRLDTDLAPTFKGIRQARERLREVGKAAEAFTEAVRLAPRPTAEYHRHHGRAYRALGRPEDALAECDEAIRLRGDSPAAHHGRAFVYLDLGD